jgi:dynein heavy chain
VFTESDAYYIPNNTKYDEIRSFIKSLPMDTKPQAFSLHENADITKNQLETDLFFKTILQTQGSGDYGGEKSNEKLVLDLAADMMTRLPPSFDSAKVSAKFPTSYNESMNTVLLQEVIRFKKLTDVIRESLKNVQMALKGLVVMSAELDDVNNSLLVGKIPKMWISKSYPSMKNLSGYFSDLLGRLAFFKKWIDDGQPIIYSLGAFFFTQSFLTGCLQNYSRKYSVPIDLLGFEFVIQATKSAGVRPEEGQYITGIYLEGARWDKKQNSLADSFPRSLYDPMPIIWIKPGETSKAATFQHYECPIYKTGARRGTLSTTGYIYLN